MALVVVKKLIAVVKDEDCWDFQFASPPTEVFTRSSLLTKDQECQSLNESGLILYLIEINVVHSYAVPF